MAHDQTSERSNKQKPPSTRAAAIAAVAVTPRERARANIHTRRCCCRCRRLASNREPSPSREQPRADVHARHCHRCRHRHASERELTSTCTTTIAHCEPSAVVAATISQAIGSQRCHQDTVVRSADVIVGARHHPHCRRRCCHRRSRVRGNESTMSSRQHCHSCCHCRIMPSSAPPPLVGSKFQHLPVSNPPDTQNRHTTDTD